MTWETVQRDPFDALIINKFPKICNILASAYYDCDILFLRQAAAAIVASHTHEHPALRRHHAILPPTAMAGCYKQNTFILPSHARFDQSSVEDLTQEALLDTLIGPLTPTLTGMEAGCFGRGWWSGEGQGARTRACTRAAV
jgi:hypothetical protein